MGSLVADNYNGYEDWSIGIILEIDELAPTYKYKISYTDEDDTDWYSEKGTFEMYMKYKTYVEGK